MDRDLAKRGGAKVRVWIPEVHVVQYVEELATQFYEMALSNGESLPMEISNSAGHRHLP